VSDNDQGEEHEICDGPITSLMPFTLALITHSTPVTPVTKPGLSPDLP
jgi:hypothetical protein